jgi:tetratricopeptide (TPR) repeat protein
MAVNRTKVVQEAEKFVARGKVAAAIKEYRRLLAENPDDVTTLNRVGDLYVQNGESDEALRLFWEVAERYTRDGFHTRAIAIFKKVIRTDPTRLDAYERLAELYAHERLTKEAIQQYQVLVDYHTKHGSPAAAAKILQKMVEVQPEDPSLLLHLAEMLERQGLPERALPEYRKLADLMLRHGKPQEAQQVYARALELAPDDLAFVTDMVLGLKEAGHTGVAARLLSRAVELNPQAARIVEMARQARPAPGPVTPREAARGAAAPPAAAQPPAVPAAAAAPAEEVVEIEIDLAVGPVEPVRPPARPVAATPLAAPVTEIEELDLEIELEPAEGTPVPQVAAPRAASPAAPESLFPDRIEWQIEEGAFDLDLPDLATLTARERADQLAVAPDEPMPLAVDTEALERSVEEIRPPRAPREEELLAEAEVFARYDLLDKAHDRVRQVLQKNPRHLGGLALAVELYLGQGKHERALARAQQLARAAAEAGRPGVWEATRAKLARAGLAVEEGALPAVPAPRPEATDRLAALIDELAAPGKPKKAPAKRTAVPPAEVGERLEAALDALASEALAKPARPAAARRRPEAPAPLPAPPPAAPELPAPAPAPVPKAPPAAPVEEVPAAPPPPAGPAGAVDEEELPGIVIPMRTPAPGGAPAPPPPTPDDLLWLDEVIAKAPEAREVEAKLFDDEEGFFDLAGALEEELSHEPGIAGAELLGATKEPSLEEIVEGFKRGVAEHLSPEDFDTHYNLGIAYREMGLLDDAIGEFQLASKDPRFFVDCCAMLGVCFLEKGMPELSVKWYRRALEAPELADEIRWGLLYDLGNAHLALGDRSAAYSAFVEVYGANSQYRDIVAKLAELDLGG